MGTETQVDIVFYKTMHHCGKKTMHENRNNFLGAKKDQITIVMSMNKTIRWPKKRRGKEIN